MRQTTLDRREKMHAALLLEAERIAANKGFAALNVRALAKGIGCSIGTVYNVVENLDSVIVEVNARTLDRLYRHLESESRQHEGQVLPLRTMCEAYIAFTNANPGLWTMLFEHRLPPGEKLSPDYHAKIAKLLKIVEAGLHKACPNMEEEQLRLTAHALWSAIHGIRSLALTDKLGLVSDAAEMKLVDMLLTPYTNTEASA